MNFAKILISAFVLNSEDLSYPEMHQGNPNATQEMAALRSKRSKMDIARGAFIKLAPGKNNPARS